MRFMHDLLERAGIPKEQPALQGRSDDIVAVMDDDPDARARREGAG